MFPYIFCAFVILNWLLTADSLELYDTPNVKTVLFSEMDIRRSCWNPEEITLLRVRMIMQDLIPKKMPRDMAYLLEFLRSTEEAVVRHSPEGRVRRLMMLALSDVLGGYLQAVAIPMAKESYYAGNIDYATMSRLYELLNEMKSRLRTNGGRWSRPVDMSKFSVKVTALHLPMENSELACKAMFVIPAESCTPGLSRIAIPYLDYDQKPGAVALPLKSRNLYSLKTAASSHIIVRFYILARQCLSEMPSSDTDTFNYHFLRWLSLRVVPHLYEDAWFPGFGSIMRIVETVNETELLQQISPMYAVNDSSLEKSLTGSKACGASENLKNLLKYHLWFVIISIIILLLFILISCCCCWWMFKSYRNGYSTLGEKKSSGILNAVLSIYCGLKDKESSKDDPTRDSGDTTRYSIGTYGQYSVKDEPPTRYSRTERTTESDSSTVPSTSEDEEESVISTT